MDAATIGYGKCRTCKGHHRHYSCGYRRNQLYASHTQPPLSRPPEGIATEHYIYCIGSPAPKQMVLPNSLLKVTSCPLGLNYGIYSSTPAGREHHHLDNHRDVRRRPPKATVPSFRKRPASSRSSLPLFSGPARSANRTTSSRIPYQSSTASPSRSRTPSPTYYPCSAPSGPGSAPRLWYSGVQSKTGFVALVAA